MDHKFTRDIDPFGIIQQGTGLGAHTLEDVATTFDVPDVLPWAAEPATRVELRVARVVALCASLVPSAAVRFLCWPVARCEKDPLVPVGITTDLRRHF